jgi:hypothetical protein
MLLPTPTANDHTTAPFFSICRITAVAVDAELTNT